MHIRQSASQSVRFSTVYGVYAKQCNNESSDNHPALPLPLLKNEDKAKKPEPPSKITGSSRE